MPTARVFAAAAKRNARLYPRMETRRLRLLQWEAAWKHYRGGQTTPIWLVNMKTLDLVKIPRENSNDSDPVWEGNTVYFLSDRNGPVSLFSYDTGTKEVKQVIENNSYDLKTVTAGPSALVYEQFGSIHFYDLATHQEHPVPITINVDLPSLTPRLVKTSPPSRTGCRPQVRVVARPTATSSPFRRKGDTRD